MVSFIVEEADGWRGRLEGLEPVKSGLVGRVDPHPIPFP